MDKKLLRSEIFRHLDGIVVAPVVKVLSEKSILQFILENDATEISIISRKFNVHEGYLNVALRVLASQNYIAYRLDNELNIITVKANQNTKKLIVQQPIYRDLASYLANEDLIQSKEISFKYCKNWIEFYTKYKEYLFQEFNPKSTEYQLSKHIEGVLMGPLIVKLGMSGMFHKYFMEASFRAEEYHINPELFEQLLDFMVGLGWFEKRNRNYRFTETGLYFARRATSYGVTVSYLPMFANLSNLLYGSPNEIRAIEDGAEEIHVDREMNVWGSGGAHSVYFKVLDEFVIEIFNQPIADQPKGILDMGCGNGALLQHLYEVIENQTLRGQMLEEYPLFLVGADYNQAALKVTRANLIKNNIWAKVIWGDIGDPQKLAEDLQLDYEVELSELLNIRTFLDHNRIWEDVLDVQTTRISTSTGAFSFRGKRLSNNEVEENLLLHLKKWTPYVEKFGLLLIELHTLNPELAAQNIGMTAVTAYDATHGFSDQYIVEVEVFHKICIESGLQPNHTLFRKFPDSELATVSINLLKK